MNIEKIALEIRALRSKVEHNRAPANVKAQAKRLLKTAQEAFDNDTTNDIAFESNVISAQSLVNLVTP
jgi:hypothetical protein